MALRYSWFRLASSHESVKVCCALRMDCQSDDCKIQWFHMVTPELLDFIRAQIEAGMTREELAQLLLSQGGWDQADVEEAYSAAFDETIGNIPDGTNDKEVIDEDPVPSDEIVEQGADVGPTDDSPDGEQETGSTPDVSFLDTLPIDQAPIADAFPAEPTEAELFARLTSDPSLATVVTEQAERPEEDGTPKTEEEVSLPSEVAPPETNKPLAADGENEAERLVSDRSVDINKDVGEDFLGIFHPTQTSPSPTKETKAPEPVRVVPVSTPSPVPSVSTPAPTPVSAPVVSAPPPVPKVVTPAPITPSVTPQVSKLTAVLVATPEKKVEQPVVTSVQAPEVKTPSVDAVIPPPENKDATKSEKPAPTPSAFKFDLSKIRNDGTEMEKKTAPINTSNEQGIPSTSPNGLAGILAPTGEQAATTKAPSEEVVAKGALLGKRTMASDMLLRGMSKSVPGAPAMVTPSGTGGASTGSEEKKAVVLPAAPLADELRKKNKTKRVMLIVIIAAVLLLLVAGALFAFTKLGGPNVTLTLQDAMTQFFNAKTFAYKGQGKADLLLSTAADGVARNGTIKFDFAYGGIVENDKEGFGNGTHRVKVAGALQSGNFSWPTDIEADVRIVGTALYFHLLAFPSSSNLDPELFKSYWVKVDLSEIAKELSLSGVAAAQEGYGSFGGQSAETSFNAMLQKHVPFVPDGAPVAEELQGIETYHFALKTDQDKALEFVQALYRKYMGTELTLTDEQRLRLHDALAKVHVDIWTAKEGGAPVQVSLKTDLDDDIVTMHVKGHAELMIGLADLNKPSKTEAPNPMLTLEELKVRMEDYKNVKIVRQNDRAKIDRVTKLIAALDAFASAKGKYPLVLNELYQANVLATTDIPENTIKEYFYAPYATSTSLSKATRCVARTQLCVYYHLGVNLDDQEDPELANDQDITSELKGDDKQGCGGEQRVACFDVGKELPAELVGKVATPEPSSKATTTPKVKAK